VEVHDDEEGEESQTDAAAGEEPVEFCINVSPNAGESKQNIKTQQQQRDKFEFTNELSASAPDPVKTKRGQIKSIAAVSH
jgi:hypothetical protein